MSQAPILASVEFLRGVQPPTFVSLPEGTVRNKAKDIYRADESPTSLRPR